MSTTTAFACVETFVGQGEQPYYFVLVASNGEVVATSEGYSTRAKRDHTASLIARALGIEVTARRT